MATRFPSKLDIERRKMIGQYLDAGLVTVIVQVDTDGVDLPAHLMSEDRVLLNLSRRFNLDVFEIGPFNIEASLSFGGVRHHCQIPYAALLGCITEDGKSLTMFDAQPSSQSLEDLEAKTPTELPAETTEGISHDNPKDPAKGPHLRLIK
ncbi:MAG: ClpXP protease specificity-enhancing factor SspB [Myxococcota bacterium]|nr:ClpXP protease specificity-enhancing factor SspB [Myxococcota bacterium]